MDWVRFHGLICPIFFTVVYVPHKYHTKVPFTNDVIDRLEILLKGVNKGDCQLMRSEPDCIE